MRRRERIVSDLTPLLDVIFIILFLVMFRNVQVTNDRLEEARQLMEEARQMVEEAEAEKEAAVAQAQSLQKKAEEEVEEFETLLQNAVIFRVSVEEEEDGRRQAVLRSGSRMISSSFDWDTAGEAFQDLEEAIEDRLVTAGEENPVFIVFTYDSARIYQSDFNMTEEVMRRVQMLHPNVYLQFREENGEEAAAEATESGAENKAAEESGAEKEAP